MSDTQQRLLGTLVILARADTPKPLARVVEEAGASNQQASLRDLRSLERAGLATQTEDGWTTGPIWTQLARDGARRIIHDFMEQLR